ncbi:MAG: SpoIID/LytB domain-containing protein [Longimicrobiales bacterium]
MRYADVRPRGVISAGVALLMASIAACRPGEGRPARPGAAAVIEGLPEGSAPAVRVGIIVATDSIVVTGPGDIATSPDSRAYLVDGERWVVRAASGGVVATAPGKRAMRASNLLLVRPGQDGLVRIDSMTYRGLIAVRPAAADRITAVNLIDVEEYLLGVVPHEIGRRPPAEIEAVKAQAIAARTYAIGNLGAREAEGFDFYATVLDQVYRGARDEDSVASRAVRETRGEIVTHDGEPILAYYSSTCGGQTAAIEESWPWRAPLPYLKSVSDAIPGTDSAYCDFSNRYHWTTEWTRDQLLAVLGQSLRTTLTRQLSTVQGVRVRSRGESGRTTLELRVDSTDVLLRADSVRWVLRTSPGGPILNSSRIDSLIVDAPDGIVEHLTIHGGGWGHGIGMCQVGALGRARRGQRYDEILLAYYTNTEIRKLY